MRSVCGTGSFKARDDSPLITRFRARLQAIRRLRRKTAWPPPTKALKYVSIEPNV